MTYSKDSGSLFNRMHARNADNRSCLFVHVVVPDSIISISSGLSSITTSSSRLLLSSISCSSSCNPLAVFIVELYKIAGSLNLKLLISS